jgi:catechol 2,3-dioxygenase-like lactoylglutathione lyase family enzyme
MIEGFNHVTIVVNDLDEACKFYGEVLGLKLLAKRQNKSAYFLAGQDWLALVAGASVESQENKKKSYAHLAFSVSQENFSAMADRIESFGAKIWQENTSPGSSLYFLDPSGNRLEIHSGNWKSRLDSLRTNRDQSVEIWDTP